MAAWTALVKGELRHGARPFLGSEIRFSLEIAETGCTPPTTRRPPTKAMTTSRSVSEYFEAIIQRQERVLAESDAAGFLLGRRDC